MSLQGAIETFAVADVLRLLADTNKSGQMTVSGSEKSGSIWVEAGHIYAADVSDSAVTDPAEVLFHLLRFASGTFTFEGDRKHPVPGEPVSIDATLAQAEEMMREWRSIEAVVPSQDAWVRLKSEVGRSDVAMTAEQWRSVVAVGAGATARQIARKLELSELPTGRALTQLVELGLAEVSLSLQTSTTAGAEPGTTEPGTTEPVATSAAVPAQRAEPLTMPEMPAPPPLTDVSATASAPAAAPMNRSAPDLPPAPPVVQVPAPAATAGMPPATRSVDPAPLPPAAPIPPAAPAPDLMPPTEARPVANSPFSSAPPPPPETELPPPPPGEPVMSSAARAELDNLTHTIGLGNGQPQNGLDTNGYQNGQSYPTEDGAILPPAAERLYPSAPDLTPPAEPQWTAPPPPPPPPPRSDPDGMLGRTPWGDATANPETTLEQVGGPSDAERAEIARQRGILSPRAAKALAEASRLDSDQNDATVRDIQQ